MDRPVREALYPGWIKRGLDVFFALVALILLSWLILIVAAVIFVDDPGPVMFTQKRVGKGKKYFGLHKFRSMKQSAPRDIPTHLLRDPEKYFTRVGGFLRKSSLDELPQIWDILVGNMSFVGPRPALWNQDDLVAARDALGANDVLPGLTGWAQINGRDELEIPEKARLDGEYADILKKGGFPAFRMDARCFFSTFSKVVKAQGVVEGSFAPAEEAGDAPAPDCLVSVVVPTYRREQPLDRALRSLAEQTYPHVEVILVDDNGDPEWNRRVARVAQAVERETGMRLRLLVEEENRGCAGARNAGIDVAQGEYITFLDDDDIYLPEKIRRQVADMSAEDADYSITDLYLYDGRGKIVEKRVRHYLKEGPQEDLLRCHLKYHMTGTDTLMFRGEYLRAIGAFPPIGVGDEFYLMERAILGGGKLSYSPHCEVKAFIHEGEEGGLSSGEGKIEGENALYRDKKSHFASLPPRERRYITMRHYAVLAFAYLRAGRRFAFVWSGIRSFLAAPLQCLGLLLERKTGRE